MTSCNSLTIAVSKLLGIIVFIDALNVSYKQFLIKKNLINIFLYKKKPGSFFGASLAPVGNMILMSFIPKLRSGNPINSFRTV